MKKDHVKIDIKNQGDQTASILIYDTIGAGWLGGISAQDFATELKALGDITTLNVHINSEGGSVFDGVAIYNTLISHPAKVNVAIDGLAASIASIIAMAGDTVNMAANAMFMIHDPWIVAAGSAAELRDQADLLDKVRGQLVDTYVARSSAARSDVDALMAAETWMTAEEALAHGFIDLITAELKVAAKVHADRFKHPPEALLTPLDGGNIAGDNNPIASDKIVKMRAALKSRQL